jgi:hypothetical protein
MTKNKDPKDPKTNEKRALQNRTAQKAFRTRQNEQIKLLKLNEQEYNSLLLKNQEQVQLILELQEMNQNLLKEKDSMVHIMDRLRNENQVYKEQVLKPPTPQRPSQIQRVNGTYGPSPNVQRVNGNGPSQMQKVNGNYGHKAGFVKGMGTFGKMRPPFETSVRVPKWTGLQNTFLSESSDTSKHSECDSRSIQRSLDSKGNEHSRSSTNDVSGPIDACNSMIGSSNSLIGSTNEMWKDNNEYPGFPQWAPIQPTIITPQPTPYHLQFSYSDSPFNHKVFNDWDVFLPSSMYQMPLLHHIPFESGSFLDFEFVQHPLASPFVPFKQ